MQIIILLWNHVLSFEILWINVECWFSFFIFILFLISSVLHPPTDFTTPVASSFHNNNNINFNSISILFSMVELRVIYWNTYFGLGSILTGEVWDVQARSTIPGNQSFAKKRNQHSMRMLVPIQHSHFDNFRLHIFRSLAFCWNFLEFPHSQ